MRDVHQACLLWGVLAKICAHLWSLKELGPYLWVVQLSRSLGKLMIMMASKGHFCMQPSMHVPSTLTLTVYV